MKSLKKSRILRNHFHEAVRAHPAFAAIHAPESNILCFRYVGDGTLTEDALDTLNFTLRQDYNRSGAGWITTTMLEGRRVLRVTVMNPRTGAREIEALLEGLVREAGHLAR